jgi:hypothetical protein
VVDGRGASPVRGAPVRAVVQSAEGGVSEEDLAALLRQQGCRMLDMRDTLEAAARQFETYAAYHAAKVPPDLDKANANAEWARRCRQWSDA